MFFALLAPMFLVVYIFADIISSAKHVYDELQKVLKTRCPLTVTTALVVKCDN